MNLRNYKLSNYNLESIIIHNFIHIHINQKKKKK